MKFLSIVAISLAVALSSANAADQPKSVRITYVTAPFNVPSIVMRQKGFLDDAFAPLGIKVENPEITSGAQQTQAIAAGDVDIASVLGGASAILAKANGVDLKVIAVYSRSPKAFTLMTRADGPRTPADLKGKKIAGPKGTVLNQLLVAVLALQKLSLSDVEYINMDIPAARAALLAGQVDIATLAGASVLTVEKAGGRMLTSGEGFIKPTTVIAARTAFLNDHPDLIDAYFKAHRMALAFMTSNPDETLAIAAKEQKISIEDARAQLPLYDFSPEMTEADVTNLAEDQKFMIQSDMLPAANAIDIKAALIAPSAFKLK